MGARPCRPLPRRRGGEPRPLLQGYVETPDQCAALGVAELVVFDPLLAGPKSRGGPQRLQVWQRSSSGAFERVAMGEGPFHCGFLGAHLTTGEEGRTLRIADDEGGKRPWLTPEEAARQLTFAERTEKQAERAEKERALSRIAELEAQLERRR